MDRRRGVRQGHLPHRAKDRVRLRDPTMSIAIMHLFYLDHCIPRRFGGCGWVYRASRQVDGAWISDVVIKVVAKDKALAAHEREAHTYFVMAPHDNVLMAEDVFEHKGQLLLALPFATAGSLSDFLRVRGPSPAASKRCFLLRLDIALQVCRGLEHLHGAGLVHQDIKPANVLLFREAGDSSFQARVSDFGLTTSSGQALLGRGAGDEKAADGSGVAGSKQSSDGSSVDEVTCKGGTPSYMSPEQRSKKRLTTASDVWAIGLIVFELLMRPHHHCGRLPHPSAVPDLMRKAALELDCAALWEPLVNLVSDCLQEDPATRPTAADCAQRIADVVTHCGGLLRPAPTRSSQSRLVRLQKEGSWLAFYKRDYEAARGLYAELFSLIGSDSHAAERERFWEYAVVLGECNQPVLAVNTVLLGACHSGAASTVSAVCAECESQLWSSHRDRTADVKATQSPPRIPQSPVLSTASASPLDVPALPEASGAPLASRTELCTGCVASLLAAPQLLEGFHYVCRRSNTSVVSEFLARIPATAQPALLAATHENGDTCLHAACGNASHGKVASHLLTIPSVVEQVSVRAADGSLPLHCAAHSGLVDVVSALLSLAPSSLNLPRTDGAQPLWLACQAGHDGVVRTLLNAGATFKSKSLRNPPAFAACENGHLSTLRLLLDAGVPVTCVRRSDKTTLLGVASSRGHIDIVNELLAMGADPNTTTPSQRAPLIVAAAGGFVHIVRALLRSSCNVNVRSRFGENALFVAALGGHVNIVLELLKANCVIDCPRNDGMTPLAAAASEGHAEVVYELLSLGADFNLLHLPVFMSPLYLACKNGHSSVVRVLLDNHAVTSRPGEPDSPLHVASYQGYVNVCLELVDAGADVNSMLPGVALTPMHLAAENGHCHVLRALMSRGAIVDVRTADMAATPLHLACTSGNVECARVLVAAGANVMSPLRNGLTPLDIARLSQNPEMIAILSPSGSAVGSAAASPSVGPLRPVAAWTYIRPVESPDRPDRGDRGSRLRYSTAVFGDGTNTMSAVDGGEFLCV